MNFIINLKMDEYKNGLLKAYTNELKYLEKQIGKLSIIPENANKYKIASMSGMKNAFCKQKQRVLNKIKTIKTK